MIEAISRQIENPFFEPTLNAFDSKISGYAVQIGVSPPQISGNYIPFMWDGVPTDSNYPQVGFQYAPRIATMQANGVQVPLLNPSITGYDTDSQSVFVYEDTLSFFQLIFGQIFPSGAKRLVGLGPTVVDNTDTIVYGNDYVNGKF